MISTLTGDNNYLLHRKLVEMTADFIKKYGDLAVERLDAGESEPSAIIDAVQGLPFLAERKLIIVRELGQLKNAADIFEQIISSIPDNNDLVLYEPTIDRRTAYFKVLKSKSDFQDFNDLDGPALAKWLIETAKQQGGQLTFGDANFLIERIGANQSHLANELEKLLVYDPQITRQSIEFLTDTTPQSRIFDLLDAAFSQNKQRALNLYEDQRAQQVEPQAILAMLAWQLRLIVLAKFAGDRPPSVIARENGVGEYPVRKAQQLAAKIDKNRLKKLVGEALDIDIKSKSVAIDLDEALKTYIVTL